MERKTKIYVYGGIAVAALSIGGYLLYRRSKKKKVTLASGDVLDAKTLHKMKQSDVVQAILDEPEIGMSSREETSKAIEDSSDRGKIIVGVKGRRVATYQWLLNYVGAANITIDGRYGNEMKKALKDWDVTNYYCWSQWGVGVGKECEFEQEDINTLWFVAKAKVCGGWSNVLKNKKAILDAKKLGKTPPKSCKQKLEDLMKKDSKFQQVYNHFKA